MKKFCLLLTLLFICLGCFSQRQRDVVYLKNGSIIHGIITEQTPPDRLVIKTGDGNIFVFTYAEVLKIEREDVANSGPVAAGGKAEAITPPDFSDYGGTVGLGFALGGGGIIGVPIRLNITRMTAIEVGVFAKPLYYYQYGRSYNNYHTTYTSNVFPHVAAGADFFLTDVARKKSVSKHGIMFRGGYTFSQDFVRGTFALGWTREKFAIGKPHASRILELGIGGIYYNGNYSIYDDLLIQTDKYGIMPMIYWKVHWNWYLPQSEPSAR